MPEVASSRYTAATAWSGLSPSTLISTPATRAVNDSLSERVASSARRPDLAARFACSTSVHLIVTAFATNRERSIRSINSAGPCSSRTPPLCPQREDRSSAVTRFELAGTASSVVFVGLDLPDHSGRHGTVGLWIDEDECAGGAIVGVAVECDRPHQAQDQRRRCRSSPAFQRARARACRYWCDSRVLQSLLEQSGWCA